MTAGVRAREADRARRAAEAVPRPARPVAEDVRGRVVDGVADAEDVGEADLALSTLQDSMLPVEVGDPQLRAGLEGVRSLIGGVGPSARELLRTLGR